MSVAEFLKYFLPFQISLFSWELFCGWFTFTLCNCKCIYFDEGHINSKILCCLIHKVVVKIMIVSLHVVLISQYNLCWVTTLISISDCNLEQESLLLMNISMKDWILICDSQWPMPALHNTRISDCQSGSLLLKYFHLKWVYVCCIVLYTVSLQLKAILDYLLPFTLRHKKYF